MEDKKHWKLFVYTCFGGCATGVSASKALIRIWEENPDDVKIACLPAAIFPGKRKEMINSSDQRLLVDACSLKCGKNLLEKEGVPIDRYIEVTSQLGIKKVKKLPSREMEEEVYNAIRKEVHELLNAKP